ncbi:1-(5-phosphoribosyl)-5-[(5-phosphoribosylamino) methylideneamino] imidazole-4-carboxamide isomerase [bacterium BMS3Abin11]|nr:1-(5-phosphoribosyl)-5-[(5-phosphoribosylamino) methylideneamino] imidazole-4-carboxamide isomerase [bacterium BMS3Abin11]
MLIIPAIDLKDGQCVRLRQGRMEDDTVFSDNPLDMAGRWVDAGARRLHIVDLNGAFEGRPVNEQVIRDIAAAYPDLPIQLGGGIRNLATAVAYIEAGVNYTIIGTMAVREPKFVKELCRAIPGHVYVGLDAKNGVVAVDGWAEDSGMDVTELARQFEDDGIEGIIYTDISRDGMMQGVNARATARLAEALTVPVVASGGISTMADIERLLEHEASGINAAIIGRALYEGSLDLAECQRLADKTDQADRERA